MSTGVENVAPSTPPRPSLGRAAMPNSPGGAGIWANSSRRSSAMMFNPATAAMGAHPFMQQRFSTATLLRSTAMAKETAQARDQGNPATASAPPRAPLGTVQPNVLSRKAAGAGLLSPKKVRAALPPFGACLRAG